MKKRRNKFIAFFRLIYLKLFRINDTPARIAWGLSLGVFCGIMPGTGPIAALFLAWVFKVNKAAALLGSLSTNTWLSAIIFLLSIRIGAGIIGKEWRLVFSDWSSALNNFSFSKLFKITLLKLIFPVILGYVVIALGLGLLVYLVSLFLLKVKKYEDKSRINLSA
ncbi:MAG: DUF2062 domain-containing protein [Candidatus Omnitrophica bacterium]|nr:DUF2062 domain-containing protein [Candidatus Omnitrophota bacterium]